MVEQSDQLAPAADVVPPLPDPEAPADVVQRPNGSARRLGEYVAHARARRGLSQPVVADHLGIHVATFVALAAGRVDPPLSLLVRICTLFEIDPRKVLWGQKVARTARLR